MNPDFQTITLKCPSCGANLAITPEMDTFACGYCGTQQMVQRNGGTVSLKLIGEAIARVQLGTDRTAAELAIRRLREDLSAVEAERKRFAVYIAGGDTITTYLVIISIVSFVATISFLYNHAWLAACVAAAVGTFVGFRTIRNIKTCRKMLAHKTRTIDARAKDLRRQLDKHHEVVAS